MKRISAPAIVAIMALVIAVSGTSAYAATIITSKQIKNGTIQNIDVRNGTLTGAKVKDRSLTRADLAAGTLPTVPAPYGGTDGYAATHTADVTLGGDLELLASVDVPKGSYLITAAVMVKNNGGNQGSVTCYLVGDTLGDTRQVYVEKLAADSTSRASLPLQLADTFEAAGNITLTCVRDSGAVIEVGNARLNAAKVDRLTLVD